jgi:RNA polymerase sigma-70 factor (ECF subfamily)
LWSERLDSVLSIIYLIFNEGYSATAGPKLTREDLCQDAIRLGQILVRLAPREPEAAGLLALMLLHDSRRRARTDDAGNLLTLRQQDRSLWNKEQIDAGVSLLRGALALGRVGPYQIQGAISAVHAEAESYQATDWNEIMLLYGKLYEMQPTPVIKLNETVALSLARGADAGLAAMAELEKLGELDHYQPYHAARADLFHRAGRKQDAAAAYRQALKLTHNAAERHFLEQRLQQVLK